MTMLNKTAPLSAEEEPDFLQFALEGVAKSENEWHAAGAVFSWIDPYPVWVSAGDWSEYLGDGFPRDPLKPCRRIIRFSLIGGCQIRVVESWANQLPFDDGIKVWCAADSKLVVSAHTDQGLRRYRGHLSHGAICEMATYAVVFDPGTPQSVANRTATTLRAIDNKADNFHALLDGTTDC